MIVERVQVCGDEEVKVTRGSAGLRTQGGGGA